MNSEMISEFSLEVIAEIALPSFHIKRMLLATKLNSDTGTKPQAASQEAGALPLATQPFGKSRSRSWLPGPQKPASFFFFFIIIFFHEAKTEAMSETN